MFAFTMVFDPILFRQKQKDDIPAYAEVQRVLRDGIVNPLRRYVYIYIYSVTLSMWYSRNTIVCRFSDLVNVACDILTYIVMHVHFILCLFIFLNRGICLEYNAGKN